MSLNKLFYICIMIILLHLSISCTSKPRIHSGLVDDLVHSKDKEKMKNSSKSYSILSNGGKTSIGVLINYLNDKRPASYRFIGSYAFVNSNNKTVDATIGDLSYLLIEEILLPYVDKSTRFSPLSKINNVADWWEKNKNRSLSDITIELIKSEISTSKNEDYVKSWNVELNKLINKN